jgi:flagellin
VSSRITLGSNFTSLRLQRTVASASDALARTTERLSSGMRINRASDDAAGLAIASELSLRSRVFTQGIRNANDGISALTIAEGAVSELSNVLVRVKELAEQSANGTLSLAQRSALGEEADALVEEYNRTVASTSFNGLSLLDGTFRDLAIQLGFGSNGRLNVGIGTGLGRATTSGVYTQGDTDSSSGFSLDMQLVDLNGDGNLDRVSVASNNQLLKVALGDGSGGFNAETTYGGGGLAFASDLAIGDFNGDGRADIAVTSSFGYGTGGVNGQLRVYTNDGAGGFTQSGTTYEFTSFNVNSRVELGTGDFDGDGRADLIVGSSSAGYVSGHVTVYRGSGAGLTQVQSYAAGSGVRDIQVADLNGDGRSDVAYSEYSPSVLVVRQGGGGGSLAESARFSYGFATDTSHVVLGDFNRDGVIDIGMTAGASIAAPRVDIFSGRITSSGNYSLNTNYTSRTLAASSSVTALKAVDVDGDGFLDLVAGGYSSQGIDVLKGRGDGTFDAFERRVSGFANRSFAFGDMNRDGVADLVVGGDSSVRVYNSGVSSSTQQSYLDLRTRDGARAALGAIDLSLNRIADELSKLGASRSRLNIASNNLFSTRENYIAAESRIRDADIAQEAAEAVRLRIIQRTGASLLAQANLQPGIALQLLRS